MRRFLIWIGGLVGVVILAAGALYLATSGDYVVPATVRDDPALPSFDINGVRLHGEIAGPMEGRTIVVLHGGPGTDYRSLLPLAALAHDGYRVVFYDQRGAGLSERVPAEALTLQSHLDELDAIGRMASPEAPMILIGHSWGAMLGAAYLGRHPERVDRAVLIEPGFLSAAEAEDFGARFKTLVRDPAMLWTGLITWFEAMHVSGPDDAAARDYLIGTMTNAFAAHRDTPFHCPGVPWDSPSWRAGALSGQAVQGQATPDDLDSLGAVGEYTGQVLLMSGACDTWIGPELQTRHRALFHNAHHVAIDDAGHDVIDDQPEAALAAIREFLAE